MMIEPDSFLVGVCVVSSVFDDMSMMSWSSRISSADAGIHVDFHQISAPLYSWQVGVL